MINLNDILQSAQGGQAIDNLSARFGLTPAQTQSAIDAVLPALTIGLQNHIEAGGLGGLVGHLSNGIHRDAYQNAGSVHSSAVAAQGGSILGDLFGGAGTTTQVAQQAATESGVSATVIQAMLPVIASILMGGLMHGVQTGGFGSLLSSVLGSLTGGAGGGMSVPSKPVSDQGGLSGMLGGLLGGLFGGGEPDAPDPGQPATLPAQTGSAASALQEFSNMLESGSSASPEHKAAIAGILGR